MIMEYVELDYLKLNFSFIKEASLVVTIKGEVRQLLKYFEPKKALKLNSFKNVNRFQMNAFRVVIKIICLQDLY